MKYGIIDKNDFRSEDMNNTLFSKHRIALLNEMKSYSFAVFFAGEAPSKTTDQFYPFEPNRNFYYLTGLEVQNAILVLLKDETITYEYLFIEEATDYSNKWLGKRLTKEEVEVISGVSVNYIKFVDEFTGFLSQQVLSNSRKALLSMPASIYLDLYRYKPYKEPESLLRMKPFLNAYPEIQVQNSCLILDQLRMIKSEEEIIEIKKAIQHTKRGIEAILKTAKPGMNEHHLDALFEYEIKMDGSRGTAFNTIVASGGNATTLHYEENNKEMKDNTMVLLDLGALHGEYASDISRTFPVNKRFTKRQRQIYELVLSVNKKVIEAVKPGMMVSDLNKYARDLLAQGCIDLGLIKEESEVSKYYYHNVSHYLGLDVHDVGHYQTPIVPGIVLTVEPGLYIEEEQIGIRIEDDILVTESGYENLSESIIKEIDDIESFMK